MKRIFAANIVGIGAVLALGVAASANAAQTPQGLAAVAPTVSESSTSSSTSTSTADPSITPSPDPTLEVTTSPTPTDEPTDVTADIYFDINYAVDAPDAPLFSEVSDVPVNDEVELPAHNSYFDEGEDDFCTLPSVDIAADLSSVTVTGADDRCGVQIASLSITLHGADFGEVTLGADGLFSPADFPELQGSGGGNGGLPNAVHFALLDVPTLQEFGASGPNFDAAWLGTGHGFMTGVTSFDFAVAADGAEPVPGDPNFTG